MTKYGSKNTIIDGVSFDSKKEALRFVQLRQLEKDGKIRQLELQKRFDFVLNDVKICSYVADFVYFTDERRVVEDVKSEFTKKLPVYRIKKKMMKAFFNIDVLET